MSTAIIIREYGGPEVLCLENVEVAKPNIDQISIRQTAIGVHYHDIYVRSGLYKTLDLPGIPGVEAVGIVEDVGSGSSRFNPGDRVGYLTGDYGAYASHRILNENQAIKLPDGISDALIATNFSRALTVEMLATKVTSLNSSHTIYVTAAAGGVGRLLCQWANSIGVCVVGGVSSEEKALLARSYGCHSVLVYDQKDFREQVNSITDGSGFNIVFDSVGADTIGVSLEILAKTGHLVNFGQSSGPVEPMELQTLAKKSLTVTRPVLFHYINNEKDFESLSEAAFKFLKEPSLKIPTPEALTLKDASVAHSILESRRGGGSIYLLP